MTIGAVDSAVGDMPECPIVSGDELRRLREKAGLTQTELANLADVDYKTINRWENSHIPIPTLAAMGLKQILEKRKGKR